MMPRLELPLLLCQDQSCYLRVATLVNRMAKGNANVAAFLILPPSHDGMTRTTALQDRDVRGKEGKRGREERREGANGGLLMAGWCQPD